jgi:hypothetical protein
MSESPPLTAVGISPSPVSGDGVADSAHQRRLSATFLAAFLVVVVSAYIVNVLGNPYSIFPFGSRGSINERIWKARRLAQLAAENQAPKVLILGSSRMKQLNPVQVRQITGEPTFNFAVNGGDVLELNAFFRYAISIGVVPNMLIVAIDEQMFLSSGENRMRLMGDFRLFEAVPLSDRLAIGLSILKKLDLRGTVRSVRALLTEEGRPFSNRSVLMTASGLIQEDGYLLSTYSRHLRNGTLDLNGRIAGQVQEKGNKSRSRLPLSNGISQIPPNEWRHLIDLFDTAHTLGIQVYVLTPPNHPAMEDSGFGEERRRYLPEIRKRVSEEAAARGFVYRDFSDFESFSGDENGFWDGIHQSPANLQKMTNALFGRHPDAGLDQLPDEVELLEQQEKKWGITVD